MSRYLRWLLPGLGLKRWLMLSVVGVFLIGLGISMGFRGNIYSRIEFWLMLRIDYTSKFFSWAPWVISLLLVAAGFAFAIGGTSRAIRAVLQTLTVQPEGISEAYYQRRFLLRGPKVVAIGGGTGIPTLLRGLKKYTSNIGAVITVADDGGSSGRLRTEFGILPPGDIRNSLVALADTEPLMEKLFQHRFGHGEGLEGHPFGNLFILAMTETTGNFYDAVRACSQVLAIRGRVMPSTLDQVTLKAQLTTGEILIGESHVGKSPSPIRRVFLERIAPGEDGSSDIRPLGDALQAIADAEVLVLGPGSLYTSIIPNLLVPGVTEAIRRSKALKVYVCNIMTEPGETEGYTVSQHLRALVDHAGYGIIDVCVANNRPVDETFLKRYLEQRAIPVAVDPREVQRLGVELIQTDLVDVNRGFVRHDSEKLARTVGNLFLKRKAYLARTPWDFYLLRQRLETSLREENH